jgi:hypothetical protein
MKQFDRAFAAVPKLLTQVVNQSTFAFPAPPHIALPQPRQHLFSDFLTHRHAFALPVSSFLSQQGFSKFHGVFIYTSTNIDYKNID